MPLYEMFCIAAAASSSLPLRELVRTTSKTIIEHGGAVRGMQYWGRRTLAQRSRRHQQWHTEGDHFLVQFDTNPRVLQALNMRMRADPRVIKCTVLKLGETLAEITPRGVHGDAEQSRFEHPTHMGGGLTVQVLDSRRS